MTLKGCMAAALLALVSLPGAALAQERGRTDGPEGSEIGKGGYSGAGDNRFSLQLDWGAALGDPLSVNGPPLFAGLTATYWAYDWFLIDAAGGYQFVNRRAYGLIGPRFRTGGYPLAFTIGARAGAITEPGTGVRFALSPNAGFDLLIRRSVLLALGYSLDLPIAGSGADHRIYLSAGYRF